MSENMAGYEAFKMAVMWHFADQLGKVRQAKEDGGRDEVRRIGTIASGISSENPLHMVKGTFKIPGYSDDLSGAQLTAVMLSCLWVLLDEDRELAGAMVSDWPDIPMLAMLARKQGGES